MKITDFLLVTVLGFGSQIAMCQSANEKELHKVVYQSNIFENRYLDSLFNKKDETKTVNESIRIDTVSDRIELLANSNGLEKVAKVYKDGRPIVKSQKNDLSQITYWNQFHKNGQLKLTGYTSGYMLPIGKWEEFDENGRLTTITDHEANRINFVEIHRKARELNIIDHDIEFNYSHDTRTWTIKDWDEQKRYIIDNNFVLRIERF